MNENGVETELTRPPPNYVDVIDVHTSESLRFDAQQQPAQQKQQPAQQKQLAAQQQQLTPHSQLYHREPLPCSLTGIISKPPAARFRPRSSSLHNRGKLVQHSPKAWNKIRRSILGVNRSVWYYTAIIMFNHFAFGICVNIIGATMVDLAFIYEVPLNTVSQMVVANNIGYTAGALAGYLYRWLNRQLMLVVFTLFIALTTYMMPHYGAVWAIFTAISINGIGCGAWDAANSVWLVDMWPVGASVVLQAAQFGYGAGITLAPVIAQDYVFGELNRTADNRTLTPEIRREYLMVPYVASGALMTVAPIFFTILYFTHRYNESDNLRAQKKQNNNAKLCATTEAAADSERSSPTSISSKVELVNNKQNNNNNNNARYDENFNYIHNDHHHQGKSISTITLANNLAYEHDDNNDTDSDSEIVSRDEDRTIAWRKTKLLMCGICLATYFSAENGYFYYCTAMLQYIEISLTAAEATQVTAVMSLAYTIGPLVTAFVSLKLSPDIIISYHFVFLIVGTGLIYFMQTNLVAIYAGSAILGYGFSAMVPAINAFTERHLRFSDTVASMYMCSSGAASLIIPFVLGQAFEANPQLLLYMVAGNIAASLVFFIIIRIWITLSR